MHRCSVIVQLILNGKRCFIICISLIYSRWKTVQMYKKEMWEEKEPKTNALCSKNEPLWFVFRGGEKGRSLWSELSLAPFAPAELIQWLLNDVLFLDRSISATCCVLKTLHLCTWEVLWRSQSSPVTQYTPVGRCVRVRARNAVTWNWVADIPQMGAGVCVLANLTHDRGIFEILVS